MSDNKPQVAVIGGGLAGITAALSCADAGAAVVLYESRPKLGGLTHSFSRGELQVDNGQHVFLRCCTSYLKLLERLGVTDKIFMQSKLNIAVRTPGKAKPARLNRTGLPAPLHLAGALLRYSALSRFERVALIRAAMALKALDLSDRSLDMQSFGDWLKEHGQSDRSITAMWDLFTVATLNAPAAQSSLALAAKVFQTGLFERADAGDIGWSAVGLQQLHGDAASSALAAAGATVVLKTKVDAITPDGAGWTLTDRAGESHLTEQVVLAVEPAAAERLLPGGSLDLPAGWSSALGTAPIVNVHIVFDQRVLDESFIAALDSPIQWVFDRTEQSGLRRGQYIALSLSAADDIVGLSSAEIRQWMLPAVMDLLPLARRATVLDFFVTREREATFRPAPGSARLRPVSATRLPGLFLAGAWTQTGWPATMESAVISGEFAAALVLNERPASHVKGTVAA